MDIPELLYSECCGNPRVKDIARTVRDIWVREITGVCAPRVISAQGLARTSVHLHRQQLTRNLSTGNVRHERGMQPDIRSIRLELPTVVFAEIFSR